MAITISGIRVNGIHIEPTENGGYKVTSADYSLISSTGKVLAKQIIGGYQGMAVEVSTETLQALRLFADSYVKDVQTILGLLE